MSQAHSKTISVGAGGAGDGTGDGGLLAVSSLIRAAFSSQQAFSLAVSFLHYPNNQIILNKRDLQRVILGNTVKQQQKT